MRVAVLLLALLLAGCAQPVDEDPVPAAAEGPTTVLDVWAVDELYVMDTEGEDDWPRDWYLFPNETVREVHLVAAFDQVPDGDWTLVADLSCTGPDGEDCGVDLPQVRGPSPLPIEATGLDLPWGAGLQVWIRVEGALGPAGAVLGPVYNFQALGLDNWPRLNGTLVVKRQTRVAGPEADWPVVTITDSYDGNTALCVLLVAPDCPAGPSGNIRYVTEPKGRILNLTVRVSWDPVGPATEELYLWVQCRFSCDGADSGEQLVQPRGTSPLELHMDHPRWPVGGGFEINVIEGSARTVVPTFTYQPYHVDYAFSVAVDPRNIPE